MKSPHVIGNVEFFVRRQAQALLGPTDLVGPQGLPVGLSRILAVGAPEADVRPAGDQRGSLRLGPGRPKGRLDGRHVVTVDPLDVPAVSLKASENVFRKGQVRRTVDADPIIVVKDDQLPQAQVPRQTTGFVGNALHEVSVAGDDVRVMVHDGEARPIEPFGQPAFGDGHPDGVGDALAEGACRRLDTRRQAIFGVTRRLTFPLTKGSQVVQRQVVACQVQ
jgi:hypothetical protein